LALYRNGDFTFMFSPSAVLFTAFATEIKFIDFDGAGQLSSI
jgi:hypothetical protein